MSQRTFKDYSEEQYAPYDEYLDGGIWPSIGPGGHMKFAHVDEMAPQHCSSAIHKLRRWNASQWVSDLDSERQWVQIQRTQLYKMLAAKATGAEDFAEALQPSHGLSDVRAVHLVARTLFEGAGDHEDPQEIVKAAQRLVTGLYKKGYVILHNRS